ncbi:MAG: hypothetical protein IT384_28295 [Deltaproteobacteria bacterium]|nr:hypothetical protein [Deltaproteobacteria bacterium]
MLACGPQDLGSGDEETTAETGGDAITAVGQSGFAPTPGEICDATIEAHWQRHSYLGAPVHGADQLLYDGGRYRDYAAGTIILNPRFGCAYAVRFGFWARWQAEGRTWSSFGYPVSDEIWDGRGSFQFFEGGSMWWTPAGGVRALYGPLAVKHHEVRGAAGYPLSDAAWTSEFGGQRVQLEFGHVIYWSWSTGAHAVRYGILAQYQAMGEQQSGLGFPTSDEICEPNHCFTDFQGGRLDWRPETGVAVLNTIEDVGATRLQIEVQVCNVSDAGTDDTMYLELSNQAGQRFYLDSARDDFERSGTYRFDVSAKKLGIRSVRDIQRLTIGKTTFGPYGEAPSQAYDSVCIQRVALYLNQLRATIGTAAGAPIFNQTLPTPVWLNTKRRSLTFDSAALRGQPLWSKAKVPSVASLVIFLTFEELESIIEGLTGHTLANASGHWGDLHGRPVEVRKSGPDRVAVDLDLEVDSFEGPEADVDFDIHFVCDAQNDLVFQVENLRVDVDSAWYQPIAAAFFAFYTPDFPEISGPTLNTPYCPTVIIDDVGTPADSAVYFR